LYEEFIAGRAAVSKKVGLGLNGVRLAADQPHQSTAALTERRRQTFHFFKFDLFHAPHAIAHVESVNSVSWQPSSAVAALVAHTDPFLQTFPLAQSGRFAGANQ
jgi:hypothetical protein